MNELGDSLSGTTILMRGLIKEKPDLENVLRPFLGIAQCVECRQAALKIIGNTLVCGSCGTSYVPSNGIPAVTPKMSIRRPRLYDDAHYSHWQTIMASKQDYFYRSGRLISWVQNSGHRIIASLMRGKRYHTILDVGCGDGAHLPYLAGSQNYVGLDRDQASLEKMSSRYPGSCLVRGDAYDLPVRDRSVPCLLNIYNLEHLVYLDLALEEMARILTEEGDCFVSVPNEGGMLWSLGRRLSSEREFTDPGFDYRRAVEIEHVNCIWQLEKALRRHFLIRKRICFPLHVPLHHCNLITTYVLSVR